MDGTAGPADKAAGPADKADGPAAGPDKTLETREASASARKKTLGEQLTLEAIDRSLQKPVDPQKLISSKVLCTLQFCMHSVIDSIFGSHLALQHVAIIRREASPHPSLPSWRCGPWSWYRLQAPSPRYVPFTTMLNSMTADALHTAGTGHTLSGQSSGGTTEAEGADLGSGDTLPNYPPNRPPNFPPNHPPNHPPNVRLMSA